MATGSRAGAIAGVVGCTVFLVLHALWIVPIWFVAPVAFVVAAAGGAAFGTLLERLAPYRIAVAARAATSFVAATLILAPSVIIGELGLGAGSDVPAAAVGFFLPVVAVGAGLGWLAERHRSGVGQGVLAAVLMAIGPGHNIPFLAGTGAVLTEVAILASVLAAASVTLVIAAGMLRRRIGVQSTGEPTR